MSHTICKYFPIDINLIKSLNESKLWFSDPTSFNDPYDCNLDVYLEKNFDLMLVHFTDINQHFKTIGQRYLEGEALNARVRFLYDNPDELKKLCLIAIKGRIDSMGVCCFSKSETKMLMWSHYAQKHFGVCLKYDMKKDVSFFYTPYEVQYPAKFPSFNYFKESGKILDRKISGLAQHLLATKSTDWKYEEEIRVIKDSLDGNFRGLIDIDRSALIEIIFGYKATDDDIRLLKNLLALNGYSATTFKMKLLEGDFGLVKEPV